MPGGNLGLLLRVALAAACLLVGARATAQVRDLVVTVDAATSPLLNGVQQGAASSRLSLTVLNQNRSRKALRFVEFTLPAGYAVLAGTAPTNWAVRVAGNVVGFQAPCTTPGIARGGSGAFTIEVQPVSGALAQDMTEALRITNGGDDACSGVSTWYVNQPTFVRRVLQVTPEARPTGLLVAPTTAVQTTVTFKVKNLATAKTSSLTPQRSAAPSGWSQASATGTFSVAAGQTGQFSTTYNVRAAAGTYALTGNATSASFTGLGGTLSFRIGAARVTWAGTTAAAGRRAQFTITAVNDSSLPVAQVTVKPSSAGWADISAVSATGGLGPGTSCAAGTACVTGTLRPGDASTIVVQAGSAPSVTTTRTYDFTVELTPDASTGAPAATFTQAVTVTPVATVPDVTNVTVLSNGTEHLVQWTNPAVQNEVVIFRVEPPVVQTTPPTVPPFAYDFVQYTQNQSIKLASGATAEVVYVGSGTSFRDQNPQKAYYYRICNRSRTPTGQPIYSRCDSGLWTAEGYTDSAVAPPGGWTLSLGGEMLQLPGVVPGNRVALATNSPAINVVDARSGQRVYAGLTLLGLPSVNSLAAKVVDGRMLVFTADQAGRVTALDLETGLEAWHNDTGESFTAGVSGIGRASAAPAFQASYAADILVLGSAKPGGNVVGLNTLKGEILWRVPAGAPVRALITYDAGTNRIFVPTDGGGLVAMDMTNPTQGEIAPVLVSPWKASTGSYTHFCVRAFDGNNMACVDQGGKFRLISKADGTVAVEQQLKSTSGADFSSPSSLVSVAGASPGYLVASYSEVQRLAVAGTAVTSVASWRPGLTLSPIFVQSSAGHVVVPASDRRLHKLSLSDLSHLGTSEPAETASHGSLLGPMAWDSADKLYVFGTDEGRVWAVPSF